MGNRLAKAMEFDREELQAGIDEAGGNSMCFASETRYSSADQ